MSRLSKMFFMRQYIFVYIFLLLHTSVSYAHDTLKDPIYLSVRASFPIKDNFSSDIIGSSKFQLFGTASVGKTVNNYFDVEVEFLYRKFSTSKNYDYEGFAIITNLLLKPIKKYNNITPIIGIGLGYDGNLIVGRGRKENLIWQAIIGAEYNISKNYSLISDVKWIYFNGLRVDSNISSLHSIAISGGVKFKI